MDRRRNVCHKLTSIARSRVSDHRRWQQQPHIDTAQARATPAPGGLMCSFEDVTQSHVVFTDDSFPPLFPTFLRSFFFSCSLFSLQVSVYVMSNWILCRAQREGRREHSISLLRGSTYSGKRKVESLRTHFKNNVSSFINLLF